MSWKILLNEFDYELHFKPGIQNSNFDAYFRNPVELNMKDFSLRDDSDFEYDSSFCRGAQEMLVSTDELPLSISHSSESF